MLALSVLPLRRHGAARQSYPHWSGARGLALLLGAWGLVACLPVARSGGPGTLATAPEPPPAPAPVDPAADAAWAQVERAAASREPVAERQALEQFLQAHPRDGRAPAASLRLAELRLEAGDRDGARRLAELMAEGPTAVRGPARILLARIHWAAGDDEACARFAGEAGMLLDEGPAQRDALLLVGECQRRGRHAAAALRAFGQAFAQVTDPLLLSYLHERARELALERLDRAEAAALRDRLTDPLSHHYLGLRAAQEALRRHDVATAGPLLAELRPWFTAQGRAALLQPLEQSAGVLRHQASPDTIVALVPLTGSNRRLGSSVLDALLVASRALDGLAPGAKLRLQDTGSDPRRTAQLVEQAAAAPEVLAALGPFDGAAAAAASTRAAELGLPLVTITVEGRGGAPGEGVFRAFTSNRQEAERLARQAAGTLRLRRLAVLRPDNGYGETLGRLLRAAWEEQGGTLVGEVVYPPDTADVKPVLDRLAALPRFEALFIPDGHRQVGLLASHLAARGWWSVAAPGAPPRLRGRTLVPVQLLGTSAWYDRRLLATAGRYLEGALIPTGFAAEAPTEEVRRFVEEFSAGTGRAPGVLEAYVRDAYRLLAAAIEQETPQGRAELPADLRQAAGKGGVTVLRSFDSQGEPLQPPLLLQVRGEAFQVLP